MVGSSGGGLERPGRGDGDVSSGEKATGVRRRCGSAVEASGEAGVEPSDGVEGAMRPEESEDEMRRDEADTTETYGMAAEREIWRNPGRPGRETAEP